MILKTDRLTLRPMTRADAPALFAILGDGEAMRYWHRPALPRLSTVEAQMEDELAAMAAGSCLYWTVLQGADSIGTIDLSQIEQARALTGFAFRRDVWGHGFAREGLSAVIAQAFGPLQLNHLTARVRRGNDRAIRLLEALRFQAEAADTDFARYVLTPSMMAKGKQ